jgi:hypothetical protein
MARQYGGSFQAVVETNEQRRALENEVILKPGFKLSVLVKHNVASPTSLHHQHCHYHTLPKHRKLFSGNISLCTEEVLSILQPLSALSQCPIGRNTPLSSPAPSPDFYAEPARAPIDPSLKAMSKLNIEAFGGLSQILRIWYSTRSNENSVVVLSSADMATLP